MFGRRIDPTERRRDCPDCQGLGKTKEVVYTKVRDRRTKQVDRIKSNEWVRCSRCGGRGYR